MKLMAERYATRLMAFLLKLFLLVFVLGYASIAAFSANYPSWWTSRNVITNVASTNDWAAVNAGQLKWFATNAFDELNAYLPNGAGTNIQNLISSFSQTNNYCAVNVGQVKNVAVPFYTRLLQEDYSTGYPWTTGTTTDDADNAMANIGQVKNAFSFEVRPTAVVTNGGTLSIQAAINLVSNGQIVSVWPGSYTNSGDKNIDFGGKSIKLIARDGPMNTVINCNGTGRGFIFYSGEDQNAVVDGFTIIGGSVDYGGGIYCSTSGPTIKNCRILYNLANQEGGGVYIEGNTSNRANALIKNCEISLNTAGNGGGISFHGSSATISNCTIQGNTAGSGGGLYFTYFYANVSQYPNPGTLRYCIGCAATVTVCSVSSNTATYGGGLFAAGYGGSLSLMNFWELVSPKIYASRILGNFGAGSGGGGYVLHGAYLGMENCAVVKNSAPYYSAGIFNNEGYLSLSSCTVASNNLSGDTYGAGVLAYNPTKNNTNSWTFITNSIVWGNIPDANQIYSYLYAGDSNQLCSVIYTCHKSNYPVVTNYVYVDTNVYIYVFTNMAWFGGSATNNGNITNDPMLVTDGYHLIYTNSPCIDKGNSAGAPGYDIDGDPRPYGAGIDMGCDEFYVVDANTNGISDAWEMFYFGNLTTPATGDYDNDGMNNLTEYFAGTSPVNPDTDGDGLPDGIDWSPMIRDANVPTFSITYPTNNMVIP